MAYNVSDAWREKVYSGEALYSCRLYVGETLVPITQISKIDISSPIIDNSNTNSSVFYVGTFISQKLTIKFANLDGLDIRSGQDVELYVSQFVNNDWEEVPIGKYLIDNLAEDYQKTCEITCMDYAVKFSPNCDYSAALTDGKIAIDDLLEWICDYYGVDLGDYPDTNGDVIVGSYDNTLSGKYYISCIAEIKGCNAKIDRDGSLTLVPLKSEPAVTIDALKSASWELGEKYEIEKVVFFDATRNFSYGGTNHYIKFDDGTDEGRLHYEESGDLHRLIWELGDESEYNTLYIRQDNPFITATEVVENIYNVVYGFKAYSLKCSNYGDLSLDAWDTIEYTLGNEKYLTINDNTITYEMTVMSKIEPSFSTAQQEVTTNVLEGSPTQKIRRVSTKVDNIEGDIEILAQETSLAQSQIASLNLRADAIEQTVSSTNGELGNLTNTVQTIQTSTQSQINVITQRLDNGVDYVKTTSVTINDEGLSVSKPNESKITTTMTNAEFRVQDNAQTKLVYIGYDEQEGTSKSEMDNLTVHRYFVGGYHRQEKMESEGRTGWFYVGGA